LKLRFLGTGTSFGVPVVGCDCPTCTSRDPRDRRTRSGALVELANGTLLVDAPPELRLQLLASGTSRVDAVWITHTHADHIHGLDDLRIFSLKSGCELPVHVAREHAGELSTRFAYVFDDAVQPPRGTSKPHLELRPFAPHAPVPVLGTELHPLQLPHGPATVYGFRVGRLGYVTDAKEIPPPALAALEGVSTLVLNALWFGHPHPTHLNIEEAVEVALRVGAEQTWITHLTHRVRHDELAEWLPEGIAPAHDGLVVEI
jgi:phosphoribosyl 1,2-cyclic phosphate phosphodiesterase